MMASDVNKLPYGSMSREQLAEKLEKSEAGRKKLRQAVALLQEKLDATEKVLKVNETLRQECENERQRAEEEKKKAEQEKKLRISLEKDSGSLKDQLAKVMQRLGAVEARQNFDKKESDCLRAEVKVAVEGVHAAARAVEAMQSTAQTLESGLLEKIHAASENSLAGSEASNALQSSLKILERTVMEKVNAAFENSVAASQASNGFHSLLKSVEGRVMDKVNEAFERSLAASQASNALQSSLKSLESIVTEKVNTAVEKSAAANQIANAVQLSLQSLERNVLRKEPDCTLAIRKLKHVPENIVDDITRLFTKERKSHLKIEHRLAALKRALKHDQSSELISTSSAALSSDEFVTMKKKKHNESTRKCEGFSSKKGRKRKRPLQENDDPMHITVRSKVMELHMENGAVGKNSFHMQLEPHSFPKVESRNNQQVVEQCLENGRNVTKSTTNVHHNDACTNVLESDLDLELSDVELEDEWFRGKTLLSPNLPYVSSPSHDMSSSKEVFETGQSLLSRNILIDASPFAGTTRGETQSVSERNPAERQNVKNKDSTDLVAAGNMENHMQTILSSDRDDRLWESHCANGLENGIISIAECDSHNSKQSIRETKDLVCVETADRLNAEKENAPSASEMGRIIAKKAEVSTFETTHSCDMQITCNTTLYNTLPGTDNLLSSSLGVCNFSELQEDHGPQACDKFELEAINNTSVGEISKILESLPALPSACTETGGEVCTGITADVLEVPGHMNLSEAGKLRSTESNVLNLQSSPEVDLLNNAFVVVLSQDESTNKGKSVLEKQVKDCLIPDDRNPTTHAPYHDVTNLDDPLNPEQSSTMIVLQELNTAEKQILTEATLITIQAKQYLLCKATNKENLKLLEALISAKGTTKIPIESVCCCFISSLVNLVKPDDDENNRILKDFSLNVLVQTFVLLIRNVFADKATAMLELMFGQLTRFLREGQAVLVTYQTNHVFFQDAPMSARVSKCQNLITFTSSEATLKDIDAGSKVLAALCQVMCCVSHLQTVVYEVLGWCDKDAMWLLTVFSSFASICGQMSFMLETDDLLGFTICAIIRELMASVEKDGIKEPKCNDSLVENGAGGTFCHESEERWMVLKEILKLQGEVTLDLVLPSIFSVLQHILLHTQELLHISHPSCKDKPHASEQHTFVGLDIRKISNLSTSTDYEVGASSCDKKLTGMLGKENDCVFLEPGMVKCNFVDSETWKNKFLEVIGALELISVSMGWAWTYNHLIIKYLWKMLEPGCALVVLAVILHILGIFLRTAVDSKNVELPGVQELKARLAYVLQQKPSQPEEASSQFSLVAQATAAHALLMKQCLKDPTDNSAFEESANFNTREMLYFDTIKEWFNTACKERDQGMLKLFKQCSLFHDASL